MPAFVCMMQIYEGDEPQKHVVDGGKITTSQIAVDHLIWVSRYADESGNICKPFKVWAESDKPVSLKDVDPMPQTLQQIKNAVTK